MTFKCTYFISTRILLLFPEKKLLNKSYPINVCPKLKRVLCHDCPVKTNHMVGVLNTILLQLDLKVMYGDILNMRQITLPSHL